jgi:hypothetical protein
MNEKIHYGTDTNLPGHMPVPEGYYERMREQGFGRVMFAGRHLTNPSFQAHVAAALKAGMTVELVPREPWLSPRHRAMRERSAKAEP